MSLNIQIMSADELVRWYTPQTESEQALHDKLKETIDELSSFEEDHVNALDDKNTELANRIRELEEEQDELRNEIADLVIERNDLEATLTLV